MFLATESGGPGSIGQYNGFDIFMLLFTLLIFIGFVRLLMARPRKNKFAIAFAGVSLALFLVVDYIMIFKIWMA
ncbi:hypothetical protein IDH44_25165 [Paenibacillus sp. IB182496]|uniref:DUF2759 family protein n=1 Tax=Paenibacillus sabuli TaxID=2772509 RepID=A0A927BX37_9BACL|nr:hypothetical protein [Paenibacillus sabuli]MBD2848486.1 hypothetical protein [Paenibacillus sabuli]